MIGASGGTPPPSGVQARYEVIVVGAGPAGLFAGALAARRGLRTLVIARGVGGTHLSAGTIDVWGYTPEGSLADNPLAEAQRQAGPDHPLSLAGRAALEAGLAEFQALCAGASYPLAGTPHRNHWLPTALGAARPAALVPQSYAAGDLREPAEITLGEFFGFRDFYASHAAANLTALGHTARAVPLELPYGPKRRDAFATDLARLFDRENYRAAAAQLWRPALKGAQRLGLPAVLGLREPHTAWLDLTERLGLPIFEIPLLPPSVPGMRLFDTLNQAIEAAGGRVIIGSGASAWVERGRALGVIAVTAGGPRRYAGDHIILATGGFRHGGLQAPGPGLAREPVFDLPVFTGDAWFTPVYWGQHPFVRFGVRVNAAMQPLDAAGAVVYDNVFAAGGLLAGADRRSEGSREGIDLATAYKIVQQLPQPAGSGASKGAAP